MLVYLYLPQILASLSDARIILSTSNASVLVHEYTLYNWCNLCNWCNFCNWCNWRCIVNNIVHPIAKCDSQCTHYTLKAWMAQKCRLAAWATRGAPRMRSSCDASTCAASCSPSCWTTDYSARTGTAALLHNIHSPFLLFLLGSIFLEASILWGLSASILWGLKASLFWGLKASPLWGIYYLHGRQVQVEKGCSSNLYSYHNDISSRDIAMILEVSRDSILS